MARAAVYGNLGFPNRTQRDRAVTTLTNEAAARGLTPETFAGYAAGVVTTGTTSCTISYSGETTQIDRASEALQTWLDSNGYVEGTFGTAWLSD